MSISMYPAIKTGNTFEHADSWNDDSTMDLANANFYSLAKELDLKDQMTDPGSMTVKAFAMAIQTHHSPRYSDRLRKLLAQAQVLKATHIAFS